MNVEARDLWDRATLALRLAKHDLPMSADGAASWAYYKHSQIEAAVHRNLVKGERWPSRLGSAYSQLNDLRDVGHYGGSKHITPAEAENGIGMAEEILYAVAEAHPDAFTGLPPK